MKKIFNYKSNRNNKSIIKTYYKNKIWIKILNKKTNKIFRLSKKNNLMKHNKMLIFN